jgi:cytochrome c
MGQDRPFRPETDGRYCRSWPWSCRPRKTVRRQQHVLPELPSGAGTKEFGLPFVGVCADFPQYRSREGEVGTLEERINGCMTRSLNGRALPVGSEEMKAFVAYIKFLSADRPIGAKTMGAVRGRWPN